MFENLWNISRVIGFIFRYFILDVQFYSLLIFYLLTIVVMLKAQERFDKIPTDNSSYWSKYPEMKCMPTIVFYFPGIASITHRICSEYYPIFMKITPCNLIPVRIGKNRSTLSILHYEKLVLISEEKYEQT